jgi:sortase (surface protein transpeptidase)
LALGITIFAVGLVVVAVGVTLSARTSDTQATPTLAAPKTTATQPKAQPKAQPKTAASQPKAHTAVLGAQMIVRKQMPNPVRISIPAIGVNARIGPLGLNSDGTMEIVKSFTDTGWFAPGPEPGEPGAAVIVGHVASRSGPAVFYRLPQLKVGQLITIRLADGSTVKYVAKSMMKVSKNHFPTNLVYAKTKQPTLRLVTCAGPVTSSGYHPDNYIVFASIVQ